MVELLSSVGLGDRRRLLAGDVASSILIVEIAPTGSGATVEMILIVGLPLVNGSILIGFGAAG